LGKVAKLHNYPNLGYLTRETTTIHSTVETV